MSLRQRFPVLSRFLQKVTHADVYDYIVVLGIFYFLPIRLLTDFHFHDLLLFIFGIFILPYVVKQFRNFYFGKEHLLMLLFAGWAYFSYLSNPLQMGILICWSMYIMPCLLFISLSQVIYFGKKEAALGRGWIIWGLFIAFQLLFSLAFGLSHELDLHSRANIFWARSNYIAAMLELPIIWCYHQLHQKNANKGSALFAFIICAIALLLTVSRGGILTILLSLLLYSLLKKKMISILFLGLGAAFLFPSFLSRFRDIFDYGNIDRLYLWVQSIDLILKKPFLGYGPGDIPMQATIFSKTDIMTDPHNFIFTILLHTGVVGLALFIPLMVIFIRRALMVNKQQKNPFFIVALFSAFFHGAIEPTFLGFSYSFLFWYCMVVLMIQSEYAKREKTTQPYAPTQQMDGIHP